MKVTHLFAVGKSIRTVKDKPSPYKLTDAVPKLRVEAGKSAVVAERSGDSEVLARPAEPTEIEGQNAPIEEVDVPEVATRNQRSRVVPGWAIFRRRLTRSAAQNQQLVQPELSLETVRVMRNDLHDHDTQQVKRTNPFKSKQTITVTGHWWTRLQTRLFARARKQD